MILEQISGPEELKALPLKDLKILVQEIRTFLIGKISHTGGHLASNLGIVELTIALFKTLDLPEDKVIWDVGHQFYIHKILSGHMAEFDELHRYEGLSEFPERKESPCDPFDVGHSPTSMSTGLRIALGRDIRGEDYRVVPVIGDGVPTGGTAHEALNNAARMKKNFIIMLNDNRMSISENVGGMPRYLNGLRTGSGYNDLKKSVADALGRTSMANAAMINKIRHTKSSIKQLFVPDMLFENVGATYLGPVDGHNIQALCKVLREVQKLDHAVSVHVMTKKGKGHRPAEKNPSYLHGVGPSDIGTEQSLSSQENPPYIDVFSRKLCQLGQKHPELVVVTATMSNGTGLAASGKKFLDRFLDVGITEAHAVTFAAGMAATGLKPVVVVYSPLLQRAYDQVLHDVCTQNLPALFAVSRAGFVGNDRKTHQGILGYSFLVSTPNMSVMAPKNLWELRAMLGFAMDYNSPLAIRCPRGEVYRGLKEFRQPILYGVGGILYEEEDIIPLAMDNMVSTGKYVRQKLEAEGYGRSLANGGLVKPFDRETVLHLAKNHRLITTMEENMLQGGYDLVVTTFIHENYSEAKVLNIATPDAYMGYGNVSILGEGLGIDSGSIIRTMKTGGYISKKD